MPLGSWFTDNVPIIGPFVGAATVIVSGFLYQDRKIGKKVGKEEFARTIKIVEDHIKGSGEAVNKRIDDSNGAVNKRIDDNHKAMMKILDIQTKNIISEIKNNGNKR